MFARGAGKCFVARKVCKVLLLLFVGFLAGHHVGFHKAMDMRFGVMDGHHGHGDLSYDSGMRFPKEPFRHLPDDMEDMPMVDMPTAPRFRTDERPEPMPMRSFDSFDAMPGGGGRGPMPPRPSPECKKCMEESMEFIFHKVEEKIMEFCDTSAGSGDEKIAKFCELNAQNPRAAVHWALKRNDVCPFFLANKICSKKGLCPEIPPRPDGPPGHGPGGMGRPEMGADDPEMEEEFESLGWAPSVWAGETPEGFLVKVYSKRR